MATNSLGNSTSPYLLQHASNPVNWFPWGEEALEQARSTNRLLLISIGYSACHWCHVMERECFENEEVAEVMNRHFVCVKVDREERPDLDQVYMAAVQLMTQQGGWPLNCVALPNGQPVWGGTYFPKAHWVEALQTLAEMWQEEPQKMLDYAEMVRSGMAQSEQLVVANAGISWKIDDLDSGVLNAKRRFDVLRGGPNHAPKFPLPTNYLFFHYYALQTADEEVAKQVEKTLLALIRGGIYDQIGGGWYRYSVDALWKVPHFEKMLYDNAQLIHLVAVYLQVHEHPELLRGLRQSLDFVHRELLLPNGAFGAALDADSEGQEGLFYTWTRDAWREVLGEEAALAADYYGLDQRGAWEGRYIPLRSVSDPEFGQKWNLTLEELNTKIDCWNAALLKARSEKVRPGFDHKALVSWNAMLVRGLVEAHHVLGSAREKEMALQVGTWLQHQTAPNGTLYHTAIGSDMQTGFLDDQVWAIDAAIALAQLTGEARWWEQAKSWAEAALLAFGEPGTNLLYYSQDTWVVRQREVSDNVIPASNSQMARNLYLLGLVYGRTEWLERAERMANHFAESFVRYAEGYSHWGLLAMDLLYPRVEIVVVGEEALEVAREIRKSGFWKGWVLPCSEASTLPLIEGRMKSNGTWIYVCERGTCKLPVQSWAEAKEQLP